METSTAMICREFVCHNVTYFLSHNMYQIIPQLGVRYLIYTCLDFYMNKEKNEEIWLSPLTKAFTPTVNLKKQSDNTKTPTKSSIKLWSRTDLGRSVGDYSHPTDAVNLVYGPNLPTPRNSHVIKMTRFLKNVNTPPYIDTIPLTTQNG